MSVTSPKGVLMVSNATEPTASMDIDTCEATGSGRSHGGPSEESLQVRTHGGPCERGWWARSRLTLRISLTTTMDDVVASTTEARSTSGLSVRALFVALRPRQWPKNGLVFIALAFTLNIQDVNLLLKSVATFVCFCALSSAGYLLNDVVDIEADRAHPTKRQRPIAAGQVPVHVALALGIALAL